VGLHTNRQDPFVSFFLFFSFLLPRTGISDCFGASSPSWGGRSGPAHRRPCAHRSAAASAPAMSAGVNAPPPQRVRRLHRPAPRASSAPCSAPCVSSGPHPAPPPLIPAAPFFLASSTDRRRRVWPCPLLSPSPSGGLFLMLFTRALLVLAGTSSFVVFSGAS
jgi:hypothetical protein